MSLVRMTAFAACSSGVALATVCGLLWLVPRWTDHLLDGLPARQAEAATVRTAWMASRVEGELLRLDSDRGPSDARMRAGRSFDEAMAGASRAWPEPDRVRAVGRLTSSMRQVAHLDEGEEAVATLAAERDRQLEAWSRSADADLIVELGETLRPLARVADLGVAGGLVFMVFSLWVAATVMRRVDRWEASARARSAVPTSDRPDPAASAPSTAGLPAGANVPGPFEARRPTPKEAPREAPREPRAPAYDRGALAVVDIDEVAAEVVGSLSRVAAHHGHHLVADVGADLDTFVVDPELFRAVLEDLVEGPLRTSHPSTVTLRARREGRGVVISVVTRQGPEDPDAPMRHRGTVLVHDGVRALEGRLWWSADPGDGVRAALFVPDRRFVDGRVVSSASVGAARSGPARLGSARLGPAWTR